AATNVNGTPEPIPVESFRRLLLDTLSVAKDRHLAFWSRDTNGGTHWGSTGAHLDAFAADAILTKVSAGWAIRRSGDPSAPPGALVLDCEGQALVDLLRLTVAGDPLEPAWLLTRMSVTPPEPLRCRIQIGDTVRATPLPLHRLRVSEPDPPPGAPAF